MWKRKKCGGEVFEFEAIKNYYKIEDIKKLADKKGILYVTVLKTTKKEPPNSPFSIKLRL